MSIFRFIMCLEAHYICMVKHEFQHTAMVSFNVIIQICYLLFLLWAYHPKTCITNVSKICQFFRFGLHPYKLATRRTSIELGITSCYRIKLIKIKVFVTSQKLIVTSQKRLWPAINFLM